MQQRGREGKSEGRRGVVVCIYCLHICRSSQLLLNAPQTLSIHFTDYAWREGSSASAMKRQACSSEERGDELRAIPLVSSHHFLCLEQSVCMPPLCCCVLSHCLPVSLLGWRGGKRDEVRERERGRGRRAEKKARRRAKIPPKPVKRSKKESRNFSGEGKKRKNHPFWTFLPPSSHSDFN